MLYFLTCIWSLRLGLSILLAIAAKVMIADPESFDRGNIDLKMSCSEEDYHMLVPWPLV